LFKEKLNTDEKTSQLIKYRELVLATIDYYLDNQLMKIKSVDFDSTEHFKSLKLQTQELYKKGRLTRLKQWFRELTEMQIETGDLKFNKYLQDRTHSDIDIFKSYFQRIDKIIEKGKITTDHQFYDINSLVNQLCQSEPVDKERIEKLNGLLLNYEKRKSRQKYK
jgi:C1A family cysteine protease